MKIFAVLFSALTLCSAAGLDNALYRVQVADYLHRVTRTGTLTDTLPALALKAACGEYESGTFVVRAKSAVASLQAVLTDFANSQTGRVIPKDSVSLRYTEYAYTTAAQTSDVPLFLRPAKALALPANENRQYWITLRAPSESDTGMFNGSAIVNGDNTVCTLSVSFYVYPFKLQESPDFACGAFLGSVRSINPQSCRDMKAHGIDAVQFFMGYESSVPGCYDSDTIKLIENIGGNLHVEFHSLDSLFKFMKAAGMRGPVIPSLGNDNKAHIERDICMAFPQFQLDTTYDDNGKDTKIGPLDDPVFDTLLLSVVRQLKQKIESYGFEMVLLIYDEPTERLMEELADRYTLIRGEFPTLRTYGVTMDQLSWAQEMAPYAEILVANGSYQSIWQYANQEGKDIWFYGANASDREAGLCRGTYGLRFWKYYPGAVFFWAYSYYSDNPYILYDGTAGSETSMAVVFPPKDNPDSLPTGTPAWEGLREGSNDWSYVLTLRDMLDVSTSAAGTAIRTEFNLLRLRVTDNRFSESGYNNYTILDSIRGVVAGWILDLIEAEPGKFGDIAIGVQEPVKAAAAGAVLHVSPNPFNSRVQINWELQITNYKLKDINLAIYDINGKCLKNLKKEIHNSSFVICNLSGLPAGLYLAKLTLGNRQVTKRLVLIK